MLDLPIYKSLLNERFHGISFGVYFHENQIVYPWSPNDEDVSLRRDRHYGFINYVSALVADKVFFNSEYHKQSFLVALAPFLSDFPDYPNLETVKVITAKSSVLHLGLDLQKLSTFKKQKNGNAPIILWNHRWEYDKGPELFFNTLFKLKEEGISYKLIVTGKSYNNYPSIFDEARNRLKEEIIHWGYAESIDHYYELLNMATVLPVTSIQDFFGISVVESMYMGAIPILPNRLAYPEHITQEAFFYKNDEELHGKLSAVLTGNFRSENIDLEKVFAYDWRNLIKTYDKEMMKLA
jgi:glycosyltransferase involved in cell wall biosynthesis